MKNEIQNDRNEGFVLEKEIVIQKKGFWKGLLVAIAIVGVTIPCFADELEERAKLEIQREVTRSGGSLVPGAALEIVRGIAREMGLPPGDIRILEVAAPLAIQQEEAAKQQSLRQSLSSLEVLRLVSDMAEGMGLHQDDIRIFEIAAPLAYAQSLHQRTNGSGNILSYTIQYQDHPIIIELTSGGASFGKRLEELQKFWQLDVNIYSLTAFDVIMAHSMRSAEIVSIPSTHSIKTLRWEESVAAFFERLGSGDAKDASTGVSTDLKVVTGALIDYIQTVIEIVTPIGTTDTSFRGKLKKAPIVTEVICGKEVLERLKMLNTNDPQIRYGLCLLLQYLLCSRLCRHEIFNQSMMHLI
jgi:hypothetical protein